MRAVQLDGIEPQVPGVGRASSECGGGVGYIFFGHRPAPGQIGPSKAGRALKTIAPRRVREIIIPRTPDMPKLRRHRGPGSVDLIEDPLPARKRLSVKGWHI